MFGTTRKLERVDYLEVYNIFWRCHNLVINDLCIHGVESKEYREAFGYLFENVEHSFRCCVIFGDIQIDSEVGKSFKNVLHENSAIDLVNEILLNPYAIVPKMVEIFNKRRDVLWKLFQDTSYSEDIHHSAGNELTIIDQDIKFLSNLIQGQ